LARGASLAAATWAKFVAAPLAPMLLTYERKLRPALLFALGFVAVTVAVMLWPAIDPGLKTFYDAPTDNSATKANPVSRWSILATVRYTF